MPKRSLGPHYSTIGCNHLGKVAVMAELQGEFASHREPMNVAPGKPGTVAIAFCMPQSAYVLKVIRDMPAGDYKWGKFEGTASVLRKYNRVHEINRMDSMLDTMIFYNLLLKISWFAPELLSLLLADASESVVLDDEALVFKYLVVQRKLTPLPIYLENAAPHQAAIAMSNLGYCIKNMLQATFSIAILMRAIMAYLPI